MEIAEERRAMTQTGARMLDWARAAQFFWIWLVGRTILWFGVVTATFANGPLDLIEWLSWGREWQWGSAKHPPLPAWIADLFARLSPGEVWGVYLAGYLATAGTLLAAWILARRYLDPTRALFAVICLDGLMYYTNDPAEFSNNVMLNLGWAWLIVLFEQAVHRSSFICWIGFGFVAGLTLLCKYTVGILFISMALYLVCDSRARRSLRTPGPYIAIALAFVVVLPHILWLSRHDFITFRYAAERSNEPGNWTQHLFHPIQFIGGQAVALLPVVLALLPLLSRRRSIREVEHPALISALYLHFVVLGPVFLLLTLSLASGCVLREIWGSPLWTFAGVWLLFMFSRDSSPRTLWLAFTSWVCVLLAMLTFMVVKQIYGPQLTGRPERTHFPGKQLSVEVNRLWSARYPGLPAIVGGDPWIAGNICCYSSHRPKLYSSGEMDVPRMDAIDTPWVNDTELLRRGGVIVWNAAGNDGFDKLSTRFPNAIILPVLELNYETSASVKPCRIGIAIIAPRNLD